MKVRTALAIAAAAIATFAAIEATGAPQSLTPCDPQPRQSPEPHGRPLAGVSVTTRAEHHNEPARRAGAKGGQGLSLIHI